jgi:putative Mn2+ efflux pump MntP
LNNDLLSILLIAVGLSADCFAVALGSSISKKVYSRMQIFRVALSFGLSQAIMPTLGWLAGKTIIDLIAGFDHWIAFALLAFVGGKMIFESIRSRHGEEKETDITKGLMLLTLSIATSIDALAVGLSFAFLKVNIALASPIIGIVAMVVTVVGFILGRKASKLIGKRAELIGGLILLAIAIRILLSHLL